MVVIHENWERLEVVIDSLHVVSILSFLICDLETMSPFSSYKCDVLFDLLTMNVRNIIQLLLDRRRPAGPVEQLICDCAIQRCRSETSYHKLDLATTAYCTQLEDTFICKTRNQDS